MDFQRTDEQELLRETLRGFPAKECPTPRLRELFDLGHGDDPAHVDALQPRVLAVVSETSVDAQAGIGNRNEFWEAGGELHRQQETHAALHRCGAADPPPLSGPA